MNDTPTADKDAGDEMSKSSAHSADCDARSRMVVGAIWRRRKTGALLRITRAEDSTSSWNPSTYYDISWETVEKPTRRGQSYEDYWLKNCEPVDVVIASAVDQGDE